MTKNTNQKTHKPSQRSKPGTKRAGRRRKKKVKVSPFLAVASAAVLLAALIIVPLSKTRTSSEAGAVVPASGFNGCGIDISHNNKGPIIWDSLMVMVDRSGSTVKSMKKASKVLPVKFIFIKATEGASMRDPKFKEYWSEAGARDIQRGAYHFFRSSKDGRTQARNFIAAVGEIRHSDLPPALDIETIHRGCTRKTLNDRALEWLKVVEQHYGRKPVVYTSDSFAKNILSDEITENYPVWIAHYGVESPDFEDWEYWQFTDRALVYGLPEPVDLSVRR